MCWLLVCREPLGGLAGSGRSAVSEQCCALLEGKLTLGGFTLDSFGLGPTVAFCGEVEAAGALLGSEALRSLCWLAPLPSCLGRLSLSAALGSPHRFLRGSRLGLGRSCSVVVSPGQNACLFLSWFTAVNCVPGPP